MGAQPVLRPYWEVARAAVGAVLAWLRRWRRELRRQAARAAQRRRLKAMAARVIWAQALARPR